MNTNIIDMNWSICVTWNRVCTQKDFNSQTVNFNTYKMNYWLWNVSWQHVFDFVITMMLKRQRFSAPQSPRPNLLSLTGKPTRTTREVKKAHGYFLNRLMHIPFDPTQGFHSRRSRKITFVSKEKELRAQKGWRAANVSPIKPAEADRYQWHFPVVTFHSFFFLSAPFPLRPSEGFSIGLLNNADPPLPENGPVPLLKPLTLADSLLLSVHQWLQKALFIGDGEQCPTSSWGMSDPLPSQPPQIIQPLSPMKPSLSLGPANPTFLIWTKWEFQRNASPLFPRSHALALQSAPFVFRLCITFLLSLKARWPAAQMPCA